MFDYAEIFSKHNLTKTQEKLVEAAIKANTTNRGELSRLTGIKLGTVKNYMQQPEVKAAHKELKDAIFNDSISTLIVSGNEEMIKIMSSPEPERDMIKFKIWDRVLPKQVEKHEHTIKSDKEILDEFVSMLNSQGNLKNEEQEIEETKIDEKLKEDKKESNEDELFSEVE